MKKKCKIDKTHRHKPMSYGFYVKVDFTIIPKKLIKQFKIPTNPVVYKFKNSASHFMISIMKVSLKINNLYKTNIPMSKLTSDEEDLYRSSKNCKMCNKYFNNYDVYKVRDHNHLI